MSTIILLPYTAIYGVYRLKVMGESIAAAHRWVNSRGWEEVLE